jgi:hypothetical protein
MACEYPSDANNNEGAFKLTSNGSGEYTTVTIKDLPVGKVAPDGRVHLYEY